MGRADDRTQRLATRGRPFTAVGRGLKNRRTQLSHCFDRSSQFNPYSTFEQGGASGAQAGCLRWLCPSGLGVDLSNREPLAGLHREWRSGRRGDRDLADRLPGDLSLAWGRLTAGPALNSVAYLFARFTCKSKTEERWKREAAKVGVRSSASF